MYLDKKLGKMGKNAIHFDHHGRRRCHMAAMGPHFQQQSIQQSTSMICDRSTSLKLENHIFITINMTIIARRVNNNNAMMIASLALLPPSQCCLACIPCIVMSLAMFPSLHPESLRTFPCLRPLHRQVPCTIDLPPLRRCV